MFSVVHNLYFNTMDNLTLKDELKDEEIYCTWLLISLCYQTPRSYYTGSVRPLGNVDLYSYCMALYLPY